MKKYIIGLSLFPLLYSIYFLFKEPNLPFAIILASLVCFSLFMNYIFLRFNVVVLKSDTELDELEKEQKIEFLKNSIDEFKSARARREASKDEMTANGQSKSKIIF